jgi:hypothetical protein
MSAPERQVMQATAAAPDTLEHPLRDSLVVDEWLADGSIVLFHTSSRLLVTLNATGALVWELCDGTRSAAEVEAELRSVFPGVPGIGTDVAAVLGELRARGMFSQGRRQVA